MGLAGRDGGSSPRDVVVTATEAVPAPVGSEFGLTEQCAADAFGGTVQLRVTAEEKLFSAPTEMAFM